MTDLIYYIFYCASANDNHKHEMTIYGMEIVLTQLLSAITFVIVGILNLRITMFILWIIIIAGNGIISHFIIKRNYMKSMRYKTILDKYSNTASKQINYYKIIVIFIFIISFVFLILGGILMSFLFSIKE